MDKLKCKVIPIEIRDEWDGIQKAKIGQLVRFDRTLELTIASRPKLGNKYFDTDEGSPYHNVVTPIHLYFCSERPVKVGEYVFGYCNEIRSLPYVGKVTHIWKNGDVSCGGIHLDSKGMKIEATTNHLMDLPFIPSSYINVYIDQMNDNRTGGSVSSWSLENPTSVMIKMRVMGNSANGNGEIHDACFVDQFGNVIYEPDTRDDNTVIVSKVKELYTVEEIKELFYKFRADKLPFGEYPDYVLLEFFNEIF